jgi:hypothetical protein
VLIARTDWAAVRAAKSSNRAADPAPILGQAA